MAASDDEMRVAATPYGIAVSLALHDLDAQAARLRMDIRRGQLADVGDNLKALHEGVRGLRTELDLRDDFSWGKQLASIRADISNTLQSEIDSVPAVSGASCASAPTRISWPAPGWTIPTSTKSCR